MKIIDGDVIILLTREYWCTHLEIHNLGVG